MKAAGEDIGSGIGRSKWGGGPQDQAVRLNRCGAKVGRVMGDFRGI